VGPLALRAIAVTVGALLVCAAVRAEVIACTDVVFRHRAVGADALLAGDTFDVDVVALFHGRSTASLKSQPVSRGVYKMTSRPAFAHLAAHCFAASCPRLLASLSARIVSASMPGRTGKFSRLPADAAAHAGRSRVPRHANRVAALSVVSTPSPMTSPVVTSSSGQSRITAPRVGPNDFGLPPSTRRRQMPRASAVIASVKRATMQGAAPFSHGQLGCHRKPPKFGTSPSATPRSWR